MPVQTKEAPAIFPFGGPCLKIKVPLTTDGTTVKIDPETDKRVYKIVHLPLSARKIIEQRNELLPEQLRMTIQRLEGPEKEMNAVDDLELTEILDGKAPPKRKTSKDDL